MLEHFFEDYSKIEKAYRKYFHAEMEKYQFTPNEILVILFLHRNGARYNTARDIAQSGGVSKGLIARSVESLTERGYLRLERDSVDRRIIHLYLTENCDEMVEHIAKKQRSFIEQIQKDIPRENIRITAETLGKFIENISDMCEED